MHSLSEAGLQERTNMLEFTMVDFKCSRMVFQSFSATGDQVRLHICMSIF